MSAKNEPTASWPNPPSPTRGNSSKSPIDACDTMTSVAGIRRTKFSAL